MTKIKALVLLSGGLDSMLAIKILQSQDIEVEALSFVSNFYNAEKADAAAKSLGVKLHVLDIKKEMLELVKNPPSGYGKNLNPCVDCHGLMIKRAGEFLSKGFAFIATGEVLGQRPFSQNSQSLRKVRELAGVEVLRPLSAKLLPVTEIEKNRIVKRHQLLDIEGRSRHRQIELAIKYDIKEYPSPAGGCLLTDPGFSARLGKMLDYWPECTQEDIALLKYGRIYWFKLKNSDSKALVVIGRHRADNESLEKLAKKGDFMVELKKEMGPVSVVRVKNHELSIKNGDNIAIEVPEKIVNSLLKIDEKKNLDDIIKITSLLTGYYATKLRGKEVEVSVKKIIV